MDIDDVIARWLTDAGVKYSVEERNRYSQVVVPCTGFLFSIWHSIECGPIWIGGQGTKIWMTDAHSLKIHTIDVHDPDSNRIFVSLLPS